MLSLYDVVSEPSDGNHTHIVDVRSPDEYDADHIPGAMNWPVLSNEERQRVGRIYRHEAPFLAKKLGAAMVARNIANILETRVVDYYGG